MAGTTRALHFVSAGCASQYVSDRHFLFGDIGDTLDIITIIILL
jgi:hypothetical protein